MEVGPFAILGISRHLIKILQQHSYGRTGHRPTARKTDRPVLSDIRWLLVVM